MNDKVMTMQDSETAGPKARLTKPKKKASRSDRMITITGLLLAGASALFPWYVFLHPDKFGFKSGAVDDRSRDLSKLAARNVFAGSEASAVANEGANGVVVPDALTTATVPDPATTAVESKAPETQPLPSKAGFRLLHVSNGRALIEDKSGMYLVRIGSILPDKTKLARIEQQNGKWAIVTSTGDTYRTE